MTGAQILMPSARLKGVLLMLAAGIGFSTGGILIRLTEVASPWETVMWRSTFMTLLLLAVLAAQYRAHLLTQIRAMGRAGIASGLLLGSTFVCFIFSLQHTTVANVLVITSSTPFLSALVARLVLGEAVSARTWTAMAAGAIGIAIMVFDSLARGAGLLGNLLALGIAVAMALHLTVLRSQAGKANMVPSVLLAGLFSVLVALPLAWPIATAARDLALLATLGVFQLALPLIMLTIAARYLSAAEIALLALLEVVLGPIWVWLGLGERPSDLTLLGGTIVLLALAANAALGGTALARERAASPAGG